jgi:hypothetical protein
MPLPPSLIGRFGDADFTTDLRDSHSLGGIAVSLMRQMPQ